MHTADRPRAPLLSLVLAYLRHKAGLLMASLKPRHSARDIAALTSRDSAPPGG